MPEMREKRPGRELILPMIAIGWKAWVLDWRIRWYLRQKRKADERWLRANSALRKCRVDAEELSRRFDKEAYRA